MDSGPSTAPSKCGEVVVGKGLTTLPVAPLIATVSGPVRSPMSNVTTKLGDLAEAR
jgi:hypothetical protein